jgi:hypothetical protein
MQKGDCSKEVKDLHILYRTKIKINGRKRKEIYAYGSWKRIA